jgi:hypothetical protein
VARRTNYSFEKQQKENKRKKKQAEKLEKKRLKKEGAAPELPADPEAATTPEEAGTT